MFTFVNWKLLDWVLECLKKEKKKKKILKKLNTVDGEMC